MEDRVEQNCDKITCPFNDENMCTAVFGCICSDSDFLNSNIDTFNGEGSNVFKSFIR